MKNTAIERFCDWAIVYSLSGLILTLPASIAFLDSFAGMAVLFYILKKINRMCMDWPLASAKLNLSGKAIFIWKGFAPLENVLNRPLQFLTIAVFVSVIFSQYPGLSLMAFFGKFLKCVFLYFSFIEVFIDQKRIRIFLMFLGASAFITAISGAVQHYTGIDFIKGHHIGYLEFVPSGRINSSFFSANGLGAYLLLVIGLVTHLLFTAMIRNKSWILTGALTVFLTLMLACLCWTYSRSAWIGYLIILFMMVLLDRRKAFFAGSLFLIFIFIFLPSLNNVRHLYLINDNKIEKKTDTSALRSILEQGGSGRVNFWIKAISITRSSPIYGTGLNTYARMIKRFYKPGEHTWYAHNSYLQMAAEIGLVGLGCYLWMLFVLFRHGMVSCKKIKDFWPLAILQGALCGLLGYLVQSFFDNTLFSVQLCVFLWMIIGLMVAVTRLKVLWKGSLVG